MGVSRPMNDRGVVSRRAVVDFSHLRSPEELAAVSRLERVGTVIVPESLAAAYAKIPATRVGATIFVPDGANVQVHTGQVKLSGAALANPAGQPGDVLIAAGQVVVTGPVTTVGYAQVFVTGQLAAPSASQQVLEPRMQVPGQAVWYRADDPWVFAEDTRVGPDFFRLLDRPVSLVAFGDLTFTPGVTETMLREKVSDIARLGDLTASAELVPVLQVLATGAFGAIHAR